VPLELAGRVVGIEVGSLRVGEADLDAGIALLESDRDTAERAARADGADEAVDLAAGLFPDFGAGAVDVRLPVGDIVELVGPDGAAGQFLAQLLAPGGRKS
jgi:hypothetical protein